MEEVIERYDADFQKEAIEIEEAVFRLLGAFYNINPNSDLVNAAVQLQPENYEDADIKECLALIKNYAVRAAGNDELMMDLRRDWTKLFRGVSPDYGPKPPYEQLYRTGKGLEIISELADMYFAHEYYEFFELNNRHDYLGTQLAFVAHLAVLRKEALEKGDLNLLNDLSSASDEFISAHISSWINEFQVRAQEHIATDFYKGAISLTVCLTKTKGVNNEY